MTDASDTLPELNAVQRDICAVLAGQALSRGGIRALLEDHYNAGFDDSRLCSNLRELVGAGLVARTADHGHSDAYRLTATGRRLIHTHVAWLLAETPSRHGVDPENATDTSETHSQSSPAEPAPRVADGGRSDDSHSDDPGSVRAVCSDRECPFDHTYASSDAAMEAGVAHTRETGHIVLTTADAEALVRTTDIEGETIQDIAAALRPDTPATRTDETPHTGADEPTWPETHGRGAEHIDSHRLDGGDGGDDEADTGPQPADAATWADLSGLDRDLLLAIANAHTDTDDETPLTGADVYDDVVARRDDTVTKGWVYRRLTRLDRLGLIKRDDVTTDARTMPIGLTQSGRHLLATHRARLQAIDITAADTDDNTGSDTA